MRCDGYKGGAAVMPAVLARARGSEAVRVRDLAVDE